MESASVLLERIRAKRAALSQQAGWVLERAKAGKPEGRGRTGDRAWPASHGLTSPISSRVVGNGQALD
jgi:hypothetical protein